MPGGLHVNCDEVWKEVSSAEFVNLTPSTEYDHDSFRQLAELYKEALQMLNNPLHLRPTQITDLRASTQKLRAEFDKQIVLVRRLDPLLPLLSNHQFCLLTEMEVDEHPNQRNFN